MQSNHQPSSTGTQALGDVDSLSSGGPKRRTRFRPPTLIAALAICAGLIGYTAFRVESQEHGRVLRAQSVHFEQVADFVRMAPAWGDRSAGAHGTFGTMPCGASSPLHTHSGAYHAIVLGGTMTNPFGAEGDPPEMTEGSYWFVEAGAPHVTACVSQQPCLFYFHAEGAFDFAPAE